MKKIISLALMLMVCTWVSGAQNKAQEEQKQLKADAHEIVQQLKLETQSEKLVYNVLYHVKTRIDDLELGQTNYDKLLGYIDEERCEMMKAIMPTPKYKEYSKLYTPAAESKNKELIAKNQEYIKDKQVKQDKEKQESDKLMQEDKAKAEQE